MASDFEMTAGDARTLVVPVDDGAGGVVSLDNCVVRWQLSRGVGALPALIAKSSATGGGITILPPDSGEALWRFEVQLDPEDTEDLKGRFYHEGEVIDEVGEPSTVLRGSARILPALIRPIST